MIVIDLPGNTGPLDPVSDYDNDYSFADNDNESDLGDSLFANLLEFIIEISIGFVYVPTGCRR